MCNRALILAAGQGTRLRPLTDTCPKPMLPVGRQPLLEHIIVWLRSHKVREIAINLHHRPEMVTGYFGDGSALGVQLTYSREDPILGTAGAVRPLADFFRDDPFVVVYGDVLTDFDLSALIECHQQNRRRDPAAALTLSLTSVPNPTEVGLVERTEDGRIKRFVEKPRPDEVFTDLANAGVMIVEPSVIGWIPTDTFYDFGFDLFPQLLAAHVPMYSWVLPDSAYCLDIGTPEKYRQAQVDWALRHLLAPIPV